MEPELSEVEADKAKLAQAFAFALMTGGEQPYPIPMFEIAKIADLAYQCGVRQTGEMAGQIDLPPFVMEAAREQALEPVLEPDLSVPQETPRVREAPTPPKKVPAKLLGVVQE